MSASRILKYPVPPGVSEIEASVARWLGVAWQGDDLVVWAEVWEGEPARVRLIVVMTGDYVPYTGAEMVGHVGSAQRILPDGSPFVAHVYAGFVR